MRPLFVLPLLALVGCATTWTLDDGDGDGISVQDGDCWDLPAGPEGSGLTGADIFPGGDETWYDGVDQNCDGASDWDQDGDGFESNLNGGEDCWDDPTTFPTDFVALNGLDQPIAADVNPDGDDAWYDGVDGDCDGGDDFDQDGDGYDAEAYEQRDGTFGDDCVDSGDEQPVLDETCTPTVETDLTPEDIHPGADDVVYDGVDADCALDADFDADGDEWAICLECDDLDPERFPDPTIQETWYNGDDENCDGNDGDQDGDGYYLLGYAFEIPASYQAGDCWDDPLLVLEGYDALNGLPQPTSGDVHPGATDAPYDAVDADCAGGEDFDADADGFNTESWPDRLGLIGEDCADDDDSVYPGAGETWYDDIDQDCAGDDDFDQDGDGQQALSWGEDCDDLDATVYEGAAETCDGLDQDCDGTDNDPDAAGCTTWYADVDGDSHGDASDGSCLCETTGPYTATTTDDCDDADATVNPDADELCATDGTDDDCDGSTDEENAADCLTWYYDNDVDGYGDSRGWSRCLCETSGKYTATVEDDCDDSNDEINPAATEVCDEVDNDCDASIDEGVTTTYYLDDDGDGFGDPASSDAACSAPTDYVSDNTDCDDADDLVNPDEDEYCNGGTDDDCDSSTTETGIVTIVTTGGAWSDDTTNWTGTSSTPAMVTLPTSGTVYVCDGTFYVNLTASSSTVSIEGQGVGVTTLDGAASGTVLYVNGGAVDVDGVTITNGSDANGGGVYVTRTTTPSAANLEITNSEITVNAATYGGGVYVASYAWLSITDTDVTSNTVTESGGGFWIDDTAWVDLTRVDVSANEAGAASSSTGGGGFYLDAASSRNETRGVTTAPIRITDSDIHANDSNRSGGGFQVGGYGWVDLMGTAVYSNTSSNLGAGLYVPDYGKATCADSASQGGGIYANIAGSGGGGVLFASKNNNSAYFSSVGCDFGTSAGGDDNSPSDVAVSGGNTYSSYGSDASFVCVKGTGSIACTP